MAGIIMIIVGYLLGSINTGILVCKFMKTDDPRSTGSGNPGANNVFRTVGSNAAALTLAGDILKGFIAVLIARIVGVHGFMLGLVAVAAVVGHIYPLYFKFKGGKGVSAAVGAILGLNFIVALVVAIVWVVVVAITRYASLASMIAIVCAPLAAAFIHTGYYAALIIMAAVIIWRHWGNIDRLMKGNEDKMDLQKFKDMVPKSKNDNNDSSSQ